MTENRLENDIAKLSTPMMIFVGAGIQWSSVMRTSPPPQSSCRVVLMFYNYREEQIEVDCNVYNRETSTIVALVTWGMNLGALVNDTDR